MSKFFMGGYYSDDTDSDDEDTYYTPEGKKIQKLGYQYIKAKYEISFILPIRKISFTIHYGVLQSILNQIGVDSLAEMCMSYLNVAQGLDFHLDEEEWEVINYPEPLTLYRKVHSKKIKRQIRQLNRNLRKERNHERYIESEREQRLIRLQRWKQRRQLLGL